MDIRAVAFDVNGTLIDIRTDDGSDAAFRAIGHLLTYQGIDLRRHELRDRYFETVKRQLDANPEAHPEFDDVGVWRTIVETHMTQFTSGLAAAKLEQLPMLLSETYRGVSRHRLRLYPHVHGVLDVLRRRFPMAVVTDAQSSWARGELHKVGLSEYFDPIVVSGDLGYRKPDPRLFQLALHGMGVAAEHTLYVGNDMYRDVYGAREAGMRTVMFEADQGTKRHEDCAPDYTITDHRDLLKILGVNGV